MAREADLIERLLIANRGEIACRILRTARRLGIRGIAVFSDADAHARHVREADEAVWIGPAAPRESYLDITRIVQAARATGADAIHPGYGFLAENAAFAQACADAGLRFIGPPAAAIAAMGSKILAKARMRAAGVPVLPGYEGEDQDLEHLVREGLRLGFPLIVKPAAGGGGKGMRIVREAGEMEAALVAARRLAESAFGDGALLLERFLPSPRHVEVQVFADSHGQIVHLGDRDCSIQRRHQKLLEEAPAPALPEQTRERLRAAGVTVAREAGYLGAGTVEFLFDGREFFFMEMNTRLQVEHTVTEAVTGLDLVEWQLRIAQGERLPLSQAQIRITGHAIEARVCAEDPQRDFLPSAGTLQLMQWPAGEHLRVDAGFATGDQVPESYDSLLGKIIAWAPSRHAAAVCLARALDRTYCVGVQTNERYLARILRSAPFLALTHSIAFLETHGAGLRTGGGCDLTAIALAALLLDPAGADPAPGGAAHSPWSLCDGFTPNLDRPLQLLLLWQELRYAVQIERAKPGIRRLRISNDAAGAVELTIQDVEQTDRIIAARVDGRRIAARYFQRPGRLDLWLGEQHCVLRPEDPRAVQLTASASAGSLTTPLPGVVVAVHVSAGQAVAAGETLMVIEAMKMEHAILAPFAGIVQAVHFAKGERVPEGSQLLELAPEEAAAGVAR